jgi:futalosine hydrolase
MPGTVLICAATARELDAARGLASGTRILYVTGVGIPMTLARLMPLIAERRPALILNIGIAGAYPESGLGIGDLVAGESEVFGDLGMELPGPDAFLPLREAPWADETYKRPLPLVAAPFRGAASGDASSVAAASGGVSMPPIRTGKGCTVNACTGTRATGERRRRLFGADFESMEGAAVALAGTLAGVPVAEIRAISNPASDRDMRPGNVDLALRNLRACLEALGRDFP